MEHSALPDGGRVPHVELDWLADALRGLTRLPGDLVLAPGRSLYFLHADNIVPEQDGNWRMKMDGNNLVLQVRSGGSWGTDTTFTP